MFCKNCGTQLPEGAVFCGNCGTKAEAQAAPQQPAYEAPQAPVFEAPQEETIVVAPQAVTVQPRQQENPELDSLAKNTLILGIVGLALSEFGLPGLIVSNIAMNKAAEFERKAGKLFGKAKVGRNLAKPGKIVGIVMTAFWAMYFMIIFIAALAASL